jgi:hypothetical protein
VAIVVFLASLVIPGLKLLGLFFMVLSGVRQSPRRLVWIVPLVAAIVAGSLVYNHLQGFGLTITIKFRDASGMKPQKEWLEWSLKIPTGSAG